MPSLQDTSLISDANLQGYWKLDQTEDTNTKLLLHFNGADAATSTIESSTGKAVTFVGNAQIDTAQKKFGSSSLLLDGTGDYCTLVDSADWAFGTGNFTIDAWIKFSTLTPTHQGIVSQYQDASNHWEFGRINNTIAFYAAVGGSYTIAITSGALTFNTTDWFHVAVTRSGNTWRLFLNGTQTGGDITEVDTVPDMASVLRVGTMSLNTTSADYFNGWIDELRIVKGVAKWTANFTPPTEPYSMIWDDYSSNGYHLANGTAPALVTGLYNQAGDFESTSSQYLQIADASCPNLEISGSQTWSCWVKPESFANYICPVSKNRADGSQPHRFIIDSTGLVYFGLNGLTTNTQAQGTTLSTGVWSHLCGVYDSANTKLKIFVNGVKYEYTASGSAVDTNGSFCIGRDGLNPTYYNDGIIDDVAIFNRALTDAEVYQIYSSFVPKINII